MEIIYVYVIRSKKDGRFYVGMTQNVDKREIQTVP
ncbi:MAG: GIY-YIG nuclease family protein [Bacteroidetes bacterium]|nr:GIY-YIG nuclease family protein [Bacteroidota bacterium]